MKLSLVIPTLNEKENIVVLLEQIGDALHGTPHEIIVVDDHSSDGTADAVKTYAAAHPSVKLIQPDHPNGLSAAVIRGFEESHGEFVGVMDADLSHDPALLVPLLGALERGPAMAVGSRHVPGGGTDHWPWYRRVCSKAATGLASLWLRTPLKDPMSGYFLMRRDVFAHVRPLLNPKGYKILLEIVTRAQRPDVVELPYVFKDRKRGASKLTSSVARHYVSMLWDLRPYSTPMHRLRKTYHCGRYKKVRALLQPGKTLDIGCGQPCETMPDQAFLRFLDRPDAVGLDVKPMNGPYEFHQGSITRIPLADATFDNAVAMEVFEHVEETHQALKEVHRVLKPGGVFVMTTPDCHPLWEWFWHHWTRAVGQMWKHTHIINWRIPQWVEVLSQDFTVTTIQRHWNFDIVYRCVKK